MARVRPAGGGLGKLPDLRAIYRLAGTGKEPYGQESYAGNGLASPRGKREQERARALGALIRRLRRQAGLTLGQLAERVPMSPSALSRTELGSQGPPPDEAIEAIAKALGVDADQLLKAAGRRAAAQDFEETVLTRLDQLYRELRKVQADVREVKDAGIGQKPKA